ncbi:MAG: hypothetical protein V2I36_01480 [Desulfopila sp.]|jgi:hypothetical protein|nr:hypothetical protein [Desulfopila sp.]
MKMKLLLHIVVSSLVVVLSAQSVLALRELGQNPFYSGPIESEEAMKNMLIDKRDDVREGLIKAGYPGLFEPLMAQIADAEVKKVLYQKGQTFEWMFYRKKGQGPVRVDSNVVWESEEPIRSYEFFVDDNGLRYTLAVPPICGNPALLGFGPVPAEPADAPVATAVEPEPVAAGGPEPTVEPRRFPFLIDAGYLHQLDPAHHLLLRVGMEFPLSDNFSLIGMIGGAPKLSGADGDHAFVADVFANYSISRFYLSFGVGAWLSSGDDDIKTEDDDFDLIVNVGARVFGEEDAFNTSVFLEARSGVDELDDFDLYGRVGAGLRFRF